MWVWLLLLLLAVFVVMGGSAHVCRVCQRTTERRKCVRICQPNLRRVYSSSPRTTHPPEETGTTWWSRTSCGPAV
jgi:hypothetical protein